MSFAAVYDASVLYPFEIRDILMISAATREHAVYWSEQILDEWATNAIEDKVATAAQIQRLRDIMNQLHPNASIAHDSYEHLIGSMTNDKKDRHVLAVAIASRSDVVVTNNVRDFPENSVSPYNIEVQTPDEFIRTQATLNPFRFKQSFLSRANERIKASVRSGFGPFDPEEIAIYLKDGPSNMPESGKYILELLEQDSMP
ncbi:MAG: PIN domain-containing protein [Thermomonas sp.]|uniref:PIN domain-containing protein n=1 Tax=Thermomonas sp. TaxID=1971895 RepID=UPI001DD0B5B5|nr:PIN domain-containing protein [Thermomonas sp.]MBZ0088233.1 PIN domain-containing protein [Thermomonas sp.]